MLAIKDRNGFVAGSVPGLARMAVVTVEQCREALKIFEAPDSDSKDPTNGGRKIQTVEGGWLILGHERFQKLMKDVSTKIGNAKRQAKLREKKKSGASVPVGYKRAVEEGDHRGQDLSTKTALPPHQYPTHQPNSSFMHDI